MVSGQKCLQYSQGLFVSVPHLLRLGGVSGKRAAAAEVCSGPSVRFGIGSKIRTVAYPAVPTSLLQEAISLLMPALDVIISWNW